MDLFIALSHYGKVSTLSHLSINYFKIFVHTNIKHCEIRRPNCYDREPISLFSPACNLAQISPTSQISVCWTNCHSIVLSKEIITVLGLIPPMYTEFFPL